MEATTTRTSVSTGEVTSKSTAAKSVSTQPSLVMVFYLDTAVSGGLSGYDTHRTALLGTASGSTNGADIDVLVAGGYDWHQGNLTIGSTASFQFSYVGFNGFTETGSLAPLKFPDQNSESERTAFGAKASYEWKIGSIIIIPQVSIGWQHEYGSVAYSVVAGFATGAGTNFTVNGPEIGRDSLLVSLFCGAIRFRLTSFTMPI
jgi:uncharacterized protein with beta-barrel porin domain